MPCITNCLRCGKTYEEESEEEANSPNRQCLACFKKSDPGQDAKADEARREAEGLLLEGRHDFSRGEYYSRMKIQDWIDKMCAAIRGSEPRAERPALMGERPRIVCLCGSTRFMEAFQAANLRETIAGRIVLSIGCNTKSDADLMILGELTPAAKAALDELHKRKIDLADEVLVLNVGGYIGESTRSEIAYAEAHEKPVRYLESRALASSASGEATKVPCDWCDNSSYHTPGSNIMREPCFSCVDTRDWRSFKFNPSRRADMASPASAGEKPQ